MKPLNLASRTTQNVAARKLASSRGRFARLIEWISALLAIGLIVAALTGEIGWLAAVGGSLALIANAAIWAMFTRAAQCAILLLADIEDSARTTAESVKFTADEYRKQISR